MDEQERKAFFISLAVALGAAIVATIVGYYVYRYYTQTDVHPGKENIENNIEMWKQN